MTTSPYLYITTIYSYWRTSPSLHKLYNIQLQHFRAKFFYMVLSSSGSWHDGQQVVPYVKIQKNWVPSFFWWKHLRGVETLRFFFTALHTLSSHEKAVHLSVRLSACQTRGSWQNGRKICPDFFYHTKDLLAYFSEKNGGWWGNNGTILYALSLPNINRFSKLFNCQNQEKICNNTITKYPTTPQMCCYTTLWHVKCMSQRFIDRAIGQWRRRLECVVQQQGEHIEHLM